MGKESLFRLWAHILLRIVVTLALSAAMTVHAETFRLQEATIADIQKAMDAGVLSSVELTALYLNRIYAYDRTGIKLNSIPVLNPNVLQEAAAADHLRAEGTRLGALHGVPYTVKDSYKVKGLTVAAGSPAFANLIANEDAFTVQRIREAGGVLLGKTNMPPMANGGMQRGVYGRAESPYNAAYLTAAWASGSSNGSGTSTAASFAAFGLGEETVSSGRSPASNNGLVAYTPSRGLISIRGNWPLMPMRDVVVPHTRTMNDLFAVLDVIVADDPITKGDFWRQQRVVRLPSACSIRPASYATLARRDALRGKRIGVPTMYIGKDPSMKDPIVLRPSILVLWEKAAADLRAQGATLVEVDFTPMHNYEADRPGTRSVIARELMPEEWWFSFTANAPRNVELSDLIANAPRNVELFDLIPYAYEDFLQSCNDPNFPSWRSIDASKVFPDPPGSVETRGKGLPHGYAETKAIILSGVTPPEDLPKFAAALEGVERLRKLDFEDWMISNKLDAVVFPANADVGNADSDVNDTSYDAANRNGVRFSNMNYAMRHLGIPSVSVSMGTMADTRLPVNLTFIGPAYSDNALLSYAYAYEEATHHRQTPGRVPPLADEVIEYQARQPNVPSMRKEASPPVINIVAQATYVDSSAQPAIRFRGTAQDASRLAVVRVYINGHKVLAHTDRQWSADVQVTELDRLGVADAQSVTVLVLAKDGYGNTAASLTEVDISSALSASTAPALHEAR